MKVMKFGGAVLKNKDGFEQMGKILNDEKEKPLLIIISAFSKATRDLKNAGLYAESGDQEGTGDCLSYIFNQHVEYAKELIKDDSTLSKLFEIYKAAEAKISKLLKSISIIQELTPRTLDALMSYGEYLALQTVNLFLLERGFKIKCIDSTSLIVSDSNYGCANPLLHETEKKVDEILKPAISEYDIVLTQGFVARDTNGDVTTMGIESSNLTATILTELLGLQELILWSDVEGIRTADPKLINNTKAIRKLNYDEAFILGNAGLKLIYPPMIDRAGKNKIELIYRSAFKPDGDFTVIGPENEVNNTSAAILMENLTYFSINFKSFNGKMVNLPMIINELKEFHNVKYINLAPNSINFLLDNGRKFFKQSLPDCDIRIYKNCSLITIYNVSLNTFNVKASNNDYDVRKIIKPNQVISLPSDYEIEDFLLHNHNGTYTLSLILPDRKGYEFLKKIHEWQFE